jgi:protein translocase SecG subunit
MSPKGGIGLGIGGMSGASEYGSKKSLEGNLKKTAIVAGAIFIIIALILPYTLRG